ncbi:phosphatidylinositol N-acetylglucosaminyltransferase subunit Q isoform X2 [Plodia interpunctella]|uniref:phosphatidylinositol N-acetylglucosaminyltransferase subunit Q isoform X2 n=1 Tax=Plodia interpunctella TaxID=58824 RepID=UPI0023685ED7|nr:phosphatidylinositol N-acetylglucosaminyltransferase subunit Q isoform X2 [Plodia interpunctella]XP_053607222.1 phosphatidylinositol N-acetylglucosaminyltransferase subunit Q isoform X2 [Plodia interpunctella]
MTSIRIFLPAISKPLKDVYFKGFIINAAELQTYTICVIKYANNVDDLIDGHNEAQEIIYGQLCAHQSKIVDENKKYRNWLLLEQKEIPMINNLIIHGNKIENTENCIIMLYDYEKTVNSEFIDQSGEFYDFQKIVKAEYGFTQVVTNYTPFLRIPDWLSSSMFIQHIVNYINMFYWLVMSIRKDKKIFIKQGNIILAVAVDLLLGYLVLNFLTQHKMKLSSKLMEVLEELINMLYTLLKWLMGSPAGFKLNKEFNKMLGKYFSYHVQLWWLFLDVSGEKLDIILHIYHYIGYLGFTFQAAIISDMICIATFHSYCIYVYAARMFNIQISGLIALLRFFVGRKYNPLRDGIDSCEYTNQELFVGTVAFTILLLLLPTTAMYYIVFTLETSAWKY